eukprot:762890-Pleurochrysis_carterae.AAC.2
MVPLLIHSRRPTHPCAHDRVPSRDRATEYTPESMAPLVAYNERAIGSVGPYCPLFDWLSCNMPPLASPRN